MKEYLGKIKVLANLQVVNCTLQPFSFNTVTIVAFDKWWGKFAHRIFKQRAKKALGCFKLGETIEIIPLAGTTSELH